MASKFRNAGRTCVCANRLIGPGLAGPSDQGPLIDARALAKAQAYVTDAPAKGGRVLTGGHALAGDGHFFAPTVIVDVAANALLCRRRPSGRWPGWSGSRPREEAIAQANDTDAGLTSYVYTRDYERVWRMPKARHYRMVELNTGLISTEVVPFGCVKKSGLGRGGSSYGMDDYLTLKLV